MQTRLLNPKAQQIQALSSHARFRAGFDFCCFAKNPVMTGTLGMGQWWDAYQLMSTDEKNVPLVNITANVQNHVAVVKQVLKKRRLPKR